MPDKKMCPTCKGTGEVKWPVEVPPMSGKVKEWKVVRCRECSGSGLIDDDYKED